MNAQRFDDLLRAWSESRRSLLWKTLPGLALGGLAAPDAAAKVRNKKKKRKKRKEQQEPEVPPPPPPTNPPVLPCNVVGGEFCSGCCDASAVCRSGTDDDACGIGTAFCEACRGDQRCVHADGPATHYECCVPHGGDCVAHACCSTLQCFDNRCCTPLGEACDARRECCTGDCQSGSCCLEDGFDCLVSDECCGESACTKSPSGPFTCCPFDLVCGDKCCSPGQECDDGECRECNECLVDEECCKGLRCLDDQLSPGTRVCCPVDKDCGDVCCSPLQVCLNAAESKCHWLCNEGPCPGDEELCVSCLGNPPDDCICCSCEVPRIRECTSMC